MTKKSEEQILFPDIVIDEKLSIKPWSFGTLFELSENLDSLLKDIDAKISLDSIKDSISYLTIAKLFTFANEKVLQIISTTIDRDYEEIKQYDIVKGIKIVITIFNQNKDVIKNRINSKVRKPKSGISLAEIFCILLQNNIGNDLDDLKYNFTVDQINLFFEKVKKVEMNNNRMEAIILANALTYTSQSDSRKVAHNKHMQWQKFMNSLDWNKVTERSKKPEMKKLISLFSGFGIPINRKK